MEQDIPSPKRPSKKIKKKSKPITFEEGSSSNDLVIVDEITTPPKAKALTPVKTAVPSTSSSSKRRKKRDSASSDEERWLTAIESGKLEDVDDELKKIKSKDPALMTARQRAMYDRTGEGTSSVATPTLMSLPTGYKEKVMTAEAIQKAAIKSQKRKQLADEKREKDKKKTMEKLLKKQDSKAIKQARPRVVRTTIPSVLYKQTCDITILAFPEGFDFPLKVQQAPKVSPPVYCSMGCGNIKKYSCSQTGVPLCSLKCYKNNIARIII